ncbi:MAG: hypothetical protein NC453_24680 [Muribaculum sp.]|nr:hypothetical protein [Muribaculum sp.]
MSRLTSIPVITVEVSAFDDEESGRTILHPIIRANADGYSLGTLALNELADLTILRDRINESIHKLNINHMDETNEKEVPRFAAVIEGYLCGYRPMNRGNFDPKRMEIRTSQEIAGDLAEMVDIELNEVAEAMQYLGYCTAVGDHKVGWLLGVVTPGE